MKQFLGGAAVFVLGIATLLAVPFASTASAQSSGVNNFSIKTYDISYELSRDENNRSVLKTTEVITAEFPEYDQNHGIERMIPGRYNGHSTNLTVNSVLGATGNSLPYRSINESNYTVLRIGNADAYVHGLQEYRITYTQHDVTRFYADTDKDEWYWDTNGTQWKVPIENLTVTVKMSSDIATRLTGEPSCYKGAQGSNIACTIVKSEDGSYALTLSSLRAGQNATVAFGFEPDTFAAFEPSLFSRLAGIWVLLTIATAAVGLGLIVFFTVQYFRKKNRTKEVHTIVVQYIPPRNTSVTIASQVLLPGGSVFSAQLIDFAVRHFISIIETKPKATWSLAEYDIAMLKDPSGLLEEERELLTDMFGHTPKVGDRMALSSLRNDTSYFTRLRDNAGKVKALVEGPYALRHKSPADSKYFYRWAIGLCIAAIVTLSIPLLITAAIAWALGLTLRPLTDLGLDIRRYLLGLQKYIKAAETERLAFFQAPDTAQKVGESVDTNNPGQILKLYERVLPYAILFGLEQEWSKHLAQFYQTAQSSPDWYVGSTAFNAGLFAGTISSFSSTATYSGGVDSSSSSGGSSGGGFSGGGGGGGGGGGW